MGLIALTLLLISMTPVASADLSVENQTLNLVCSNDNCSLSEDGVGDVMLSDEERQANLLQPVTITLEFPMQPDVLPAAPTMSEEAAWTLWLVLVLQVMVPGLQTGRRRVPIEVQSIV